MRERIYVFLKMMCNSGTAFAFNNLLLLYGAQDNYIYGDYDEETADSLFVICYYFNCS